MDGPAADATSQCTPGLPYNLEIAHMCYAISRLRTRVTLPRHFLVAPRLPRDSENAQCNLEIARIPRLRGTAIQPRNITIEPQTVHPLSNVMRR